MSRRKLIQKVMKSQAQNVDASSLLTKKGGLTPPFVYIRCRQASETKRLLRHYGKYQAELRLFLFPVFQ